MYRIVKNGEKNNNRLQAIAITDLYFKILMFIAVNM